MILLGKTITVIASPNAELVGTTGTVLTDTRETLVIRDSAGEERSLVKHTITIAVDGRALAPRELRGTHAQRLRR